MSDFFEDKKPTEETVEEELAKIKIGEEEYDPAEAQKLMELGKLGREAEEKYHTKIDKVWPEFGRSQNELKAEREKRVELEKQLADIQTKSQQTDQQNFQALPQDQQELVKRQLEQIYGGPIMTKQDYALQQQTAALLDECHVLEKQIDGEDGRPKFATEAVLKHMSEYGFKNPEKAYKDLYETEIDDWKAKQLQSKKGTGFYTNASTSQSKSPAPVKVTKDNLSQLVAEMVNEGENL